MGWFSGKTRVSVASTAVNLVADIPDISKDSILASILTGKTDTMIPDMISAHLNGLANKMNNALVYAEDHYTLGLPQGTMELGKGDDILVKPILQELEGSPVQIITNVFDTADASMMSYFHLQTNRDWDSDTDIVASPPFTPPGGSSDVLYVNSKFTSSNNIQITYSYTNGGTFFETEDLTFVAEPKDLYYHVIYVTLNADQTLVTSPAKYFIYRVKDGTYPTLDLIGINPVSPYFPIIPIRQNNVDLTDISKSGTELYQTSEKLLDILGLEYTALGKDINENPDVADIDHATVVFGVDLSSDTQASKDYLYEYFSYLSGFSDHNKDEYDTWLASNRNQQPPLNVTVIEDASLKYEIAFNYVDPVVKTGSVGPIGTVTRVTNILAPYTHTETLIRGGEAQEEYQHTIYDTEVSTVVFNKQIGVNTYVELTVHGLIHTNHVYESHTVETTVALSADPDDNNFVIPLNQFVVNELSINSRNALMFESLKIIFNSYSVTKSKWYETRFFKFVLVVAAVVITVISAGQDGGWAMQTALALGFSGTAALLASIVITIAVGQIMAKLFTVVIEAVGLDNALLLTLIAVTALIVTISVTGSIKDAPFAEELLFAVNAIQTGTAGALEEAAESLASEYQEFLTQHEKELALLEEAEALLDTSSDLDPNLFLDPSAFIFFDETPTEFYTRTIHAGNVGIESINAISLYVETKLELPTLSDTLIG